MKVFVAGATGQLGLAAVRALVAAGHDVLGTARTSEKAAALRSLGAEPVGIDLFDRDAVRRALKGVTAVVRLTTKIPPLLQMRRVEAWAEIAAPPGRLARAKSRHPSSPRSPQVTVLPRRHMWLILLV